MKFLGTPFARATLLACVLLMTGAASAVAADYEQGFESLAGSGWTTVELSEVASAKPWSQGAHSTNYSAHSGSDDSFVSGTLSPDPYEWDKEQNDWLISPKFSTLSNGDEISFYMRALTVYFKLIYSYEDLELRVSSNGSCSPGSTSSSVGDFSTRIMHLDSARNTERWDWNSPTTPPHSVNPIWTEESAIIAGLPEGEHSGCIAIRHSTPGTNGAHPLVGIDDFKFEEGVPSPGAIKLLEPIAPSISVERRRWYHGRIAPDSTVSLYTTADCSDSAFATNLSSDDFQWPGGSFRVPENGSIHLAARVTDGTGTQHDCQLLADYFHDTLAPATVDDLDASTDYPSPVKLTATDAGTGVATTFYEISEDSAPAGTPSTIYDPAAPPILNPGQWIHYFSVDRAGNTETVKTSGPAPTGASTGPPTASGNVVAAGGSASVVRPSRSALKLKRGRVTVELVCVGARGDKPCIGSVSIRAKYFVAGAPKLISVRPAAYSLEGGSKGRVSLALTRSARKRVAKSHGKGSPVQIKISPAGTAQPEYFSRKIVG